MAGEVATHLLSDRFDEAKAAAEWYANVFKDRYYLEVQAHDAGEQKKLNKSIFKLAKTLNLPVVATNNLAASKDARRLMLWTAALTALLALAMDGEGAMIAMGVKVGLLPK